MNGKLWFIYQTFDLFQDKTEFINIIEIGTKSSPKFVFSNPIFSHPDVVYF